MGDSAESQRRVCGGNGTAAGRVSTDVRTTLTPVVCMDETPRQLIAETREPIAASAGQPCRVDYEYRRMGTCNVFMAAEPLAGIRMTKVTERRAKRDFAQFLSDIAERYRRNPSLW